MTANPTERTMITDPDVFFTRGCGRCARFDTPDCSARLWHDTLLELRALCREVGLTETAKWGHPCYMHAGRNIALIGAFRRDVRVTFFKAALLADPHGLLERQGPNTQSRDMMRFTSRLAVSERADSLRAYLREAMDHAAAGRVPEWRPAEFDLPDELVEALDADPVLAEAFHALTPGRQRSYALHVGSAKAARTRMARIDRSRSGILAGKGANER